MTGGGDAPGLNGVIESVSKCLLRANHLPVGIQDGFLGVFEGRTRIIRLEDLIGLHAQAGTFLGTSNKCGTAGREQEFLTKFKELGLDGLVAAGGDGTFRGLEPFKDEIPLIGVPKTIDNDLSGTEATFGFDTACSVVAESVDALRATAEAHRRLIVVEAMGRTAGWIALGGGMASYADAILIPERKFSRAKLFAFLAEKMKVQRGAVLVVSEGATAENEEAQVAFRVEGAPQAERYGGIAHLLAHQVEAATGWEARAVVLGHLQRSRAPTTTDRFLTLALGVQVAAMVQEKAWGKAVVYRSGRIERVPVEELMGPPRLVDPDHRWVKMAQALGIFI